MAKKDMKQTMAKGLGSLLQPTTAKETTKAPTTTAAEPTAEPELVAAGVRRSPQGRKAVIRPHSTSVKNGLAEGYTRATVIARVEQIDKLKEIAYQNRSTVKAELELALEKYIAAFERQHGKIVL